MINNISNLNRAIKNGRAIKYEITTTGQQIIQPIQTEDKKQNKIPNKKSEKVLAIPLATAINPNQNNVGNTIIEYKPIASPKPEPEQIPIAREMYIREKKSLTTPEVETKQNILAELQYEEKNETVKKEYVPYDIPQLEILVDILNSSKNTAKSVYYWWLGATYRSATGETTKTEYLKEMDKKYIEYRDISRNYIKAYREKIEKEPSYVQKFSASLGAEMLRTLTDIRQLPFILATSGIGAAASTSIGITSTVGKIGFTGLLNGIENMLQDSLDIYLTEDRTPTAGEVITSGVAGAALTYGIAGAGVATKSIGKKVSSTIQSFFEDTDILKKAKQSIKQSEKKVNDFAKKHKGDTSNMDYNNIKTAAENVDEMNEFRGVRTNAGKTMENYIAFGGYSVKEIEEQVPFFMEAMIKSNYIDYIKTPEDFINAINTNPYRVFEDANKLYNHFHGLTDEELDALEYFLENVSADRLPDFEFDVNRAFEEVVKKTDTLKNDYSPTYEDVPKTKVEALKETPITEKPKSQGQIVLSRILGDENVNINSTDEFKKILTENPIELKKIVDDFIQNKELTPEEAESFKAFSKILDEANIEKPKNVRDVNEQLNNNTQTENIPSYNEIKLTRKIVDSDTYNKVKKEIKHNYRDFPAGTLQDLLIKEEIIPKEAVIKFARGVKNKSSFTSTVGLNSWGEPIYSRKKWVEKDWYANFEYEYNGRKYYGETTFAADLDYKPITEIYELDPNAKAGTKIDTTPKIENTVIDDGVDNLVDDINGKPNIETEPISIEEMREVAYRELGLNKKFEDIGENRINEDLILHYTKKVGKIIREKYNVNSLEEMAELYRKKYGIDFSLKKINNSDGLQGTTKIKRIKGTNELADKIEISINENIVDLDTQLGVLRHEIQHVMDFYKKPEFRSTPFSKFRVLSKDEIGVKLNELGAGHFADFPDEYFELSYIIKNKLDNLIKGEKLNDEIVEVLKLEVPKIIEENDIEALKEIVQEVVQNTDDVSKSLAELRRRFSNYTTMKNKINQIFDKYPGTGKASKAISETINTNIILPFEKSEQQNLGILLKLFNIEFNGSKLNPEKLMDLFEKNDSRLTNYIFYDGDIELPDNLKGMEQELLNIKTQLNDFIDKLVEGSSLTRKDVIENIMYDPMNSLEKSLPDEILNKYIDKSTLMFDEDKFLRGDKEFDEILGEEIYTKLKEPIDNFIEKNYQFFDDAKTVLENNLEFRKDLNQDEIITLLKRAKKCMTASEKKALVEKYNLHELDKVSKYLNESNYFVEYKPEALEKNILKSKKDNAKIFFVRDMQSKKGEMKGVTSGTSLHRFRRFERFLFKDRIISRKNLSKLVKANSVSDRIALNKLLKHLSQARAEKDILPGGNINTFSRMLKENQKTALNPNYKTYIEFIRNEIKSNIGEKVGMVTKVSPTNLDKVVWKIIKPINKVSLTGFKAFKDFVFEVPVMSRAGVMLYGDKGFRDTFKYLAKAFNILYVNKKQLSKVNSVLGESYDNSVSVKCLTSILDDMNDFTGATKNRIMQKGTWLDKKMYKLNEGIDKVNWYHIPQRIMKLHSYFRSSYIMERMSKYIDVHDLYAHSSHYVKDLFFDIGITDFEFKFLKKFADSSTYKKTGLFDEVDFADSISIEDVANFLKKDKITNEEFEIVRDSIVKKISNLYEKIVHDTSPTEVNGSLRYSIDNINNDVQRNFVRAMANFKASITVGWDRALRDIVRSNLNNGKFDWGNKIYYKRLLNTFLGTAAFFGTVDLIRDPDFYEDPFGTIEDKIDELVDNPGSALWYILDQQLNTWALINGSSVARRVITIGQNLTKGEVEKATQGIIKAMLGTTNVEMGKKAYEKIEDVID